MNLKVYLFTFIFLPVSSIIHGYQANQFEILSQVSIFSRFSDSPNNETLLCGGVLIASNIVLTAAHCLHQSGYFANVVKVTVRDYDVSKHDEGEQVYFSRALLLHPDYGTSDSNSDVAIIFLPKPVKNLCENNPISPMIAQIPPTNYLKYNNYKSAVFSNQELEQSLCYTAGWGRTHSGNYSETPNQMLLKLTVKMHFGKPLLLASGIVDGTRICMGDSGSPVYCYLDGKRFMIGIISEIGNFGKSKTSNLEDQISICNDYKFAIIADWRKSSEKIVRLLKRYNQFDQLQISQDMCYS